jgi:hypothetical protein
MSDVLKLLYFFVAVSQEKVRETNHWIPLEKHTFV